MKTATENMETKMIFLSETESENDFSLYRPYLELPYLSDNLPPVLLYLRPNHNTYFPWTLAQLARGLSAGLASQANPSLKRNRVPGHSPMPQTPAPMTCRPPAQLPLHVYRRLAIPYPPASGAIPQQRLPATQHRTMAPARRCIVSRTIDATVFDFG